MSHLVHEYEIFAAARDNNVKKVRELLDAGVDINVFDLDRHQTPLHLACAHGCKAVVELLVKRGADLNVKDGNETTPLHHLVKNKFDVLAMWFVHCGADIHAKDRKMFSPLDYALPSTQHDLRVAAGEISAGPGDKGDGKNPAEPQLYRTPRVAAAPPSPSVTRSADLRVYLRNGSYKTVRVTPDTNCGTLAKLAAEKFNIDPQYAPYVNLYESKQGTERRVSAIENVFNLRQKWPHILASSGNVTLEKCFFVIVCSSAAPDSVKDYFAQLR